jgi:hypothetical protein
VQPLKLSLEPVTGGNFTLRATDADGSLLTPQRAARISFLTSTDPALPIAAWTPVAGTPVLDNGALSVNVSTQAGAPVRFFRAVEWQ